MNLEIVNQMEKELRIKSKYIKVVLDLLDNGSTVPFIARYRKELTNSLNEDQIREIEKVYKYQNNLKDRKEEVKRLIAEKEMLTKEIEKAIDSAQKLQEVEDIYLPFKEKKKTKATEAIKNGLEPLAEMIVSFQYNMEEINEKSKEFINDKVTSSKKALEGAGHIISERISDNAKYRKIIREESQRNGLIQTKIKRGASEKDPLKKYEIYYDFIQQVKKIPSYRTLAFNRAEKEKVLNVKLVLDNEKIIEKILTLEIGQMNSDVRNFYLELIQDAYKRLMFPSIEREIRKDLTEKAEITAIELFSKNLEELISQPPLKNKWILGVDPAFRTGCKLAVINPQSKMILVDVIYPHPSQNEMNNIDKLHKEASKKINNILNEYPIECIAVGNGTASRETEKFLKDNVSKIPIAIISEDGASVYSASTIAKKEFPNLEVEQRSAVSIARRLQDPMAELVKIDPKSIGVGQYQYDVNQKNLSENLDFIMVKNINKIGVDLNTASAELLKYVSGLDKSVAKNIVDYRDENGAFTNRKQLLKVKRLGAKAFEQSAGFLNISTGDNVYDSLFIHPEKYEVADRILNYLECTKDDLGKDEIIKKISKVNIIDLQEKINIDYIVLSDILNIFKNPQIDVRKELEIVEFNPQINSITDLKEGMKVKGQVRNIVQFGAFVDIGIKNNGLVHVSEISNNFVKDVNDYLKIGDVLDFKIKSIDIEKGNVQLTLKEEN